MKKTDIWKVIEQMNWSLDNNYKRISKNLKNGQYCDKKDIKSLEEEYLVLYRKLEKEYLRQLDIANKKDIIWDYGYYIGDDGISDYLADIIGQGEEHYNSFFTDEAIKSMKIYMEAKPSKESFAYSFHID